MTRANHVESYYAATAHAAPRAPVLEDSINCDVCVIGGGITGCATALTLAEKGYSIVLLEAKRIGWGASGRSGAQVISGFARDIDAIENLVGQAHARRLWDLSRDAVGLVQSLIKQHAIDCDWRPGQLHVALKARQQRELKAYHALLASRYDTSLDYLEGAALRAQVNSARYCAGLFDREAGHLHPLNYTLGLAAAADRAGVRIYEDSAVTQYTSGVAPRFVTARGEVRAKFGVFAGNAYLGRLVPELDRKIMPVGTYIVATQPLDPARAAAILPTNAAVTDMNFVLDYFRLSIERRLLFGGRVSYSTIPPANLKATMRARLRKVFPQLQDVPVDYAWGGYVDISFNRAPHFGRLGANLYFAQGFSGHGMALTSLAGQLIAEAIAGDAERFDVFARIPHRDFPGGRLFRVPALLLGTFYYRLRDLL